MTFNSSKIIKTSCIVLTSLFFFLLQTTGLNAQIESLDSQLQNKSTKVEQSAKGPPNIDNYSLNQPVKVTASIGEYKATIFGYGPTLSTVTLDAIGIAAITTSDETGYFEFKNVYLPTPNSDQPSNNYFFPEICIMAVDKNSISTAPTCIPHFVADNYTYRIGPVILPPTIMVSTFKAIVNDNVKVSGRITPNTDITIYLAENGSKTIFSFIKNAFAYYIPEYQIRSDASGNYEFNLPTTNSDSWRLFTAATIQGGNSPKSNTLFFSVKPWYFVIIDKLRIVISTVFSNKFSIIILIEFLILVSLIIAIKRVDLNTSKNIKATKEKLKENKKEKKTEGKPIQLVQDQNVLEKYLKLIRSKKSL